MSNTDIVLQTRDREHLRLLAIFHYVFAGLSLCGLGFIVVHFAIMRTVFSPEHWQPSSGEPPPPELMWIFFCFYLVLGTIILLVGVLNLLAGNFLRTYRNRTFCLVVAGINCLQFPFGTVLGVFTLTTLTRDSMRELFVQPPTAG